MFLLLIFGILSFSTVIGQHFSYDGSEGPSHWGDKYHQCIGKHQSPINIEEHDVQTIRLPPMVFANFDVMPQEAKIENNGHTVIITLKTNDSQNIPKIGGGPLIGSYEFSQMHFHWGSNDAEGSENTINNNSFPMELHMVFFQQGYGDVKQAMEHPDGLTVLSFLYARSENPNKNYAAITNALPKVENVHSSTVIAPMPSLDSLIIDNRSIYFTYGGSLTTPPCSEVVTWIEFKNTIPLAHSQIESFRHLKDPFGRLMSHNFRPTQPLHGRLIRMVRDDKSDFPDYHKQELKSESGSNSANRLFGLKYYSQMLALLVLLFSIVFTCLSRVESFL